MSATPDPTDASADGNFGSSGSNRRAGYSTDKLANAEYWARKGGTLNAGEGAILCKEIDRLREQVDEAYGELSISRLACEQLQKQLTAVQRDAERYRAIRDMRVAVEWRIEMYQDSWGVRLVRPKLDASGYFEGRYEAHYSGLDEAIDALCTAIAAAEEGK